MLDRCLLLSAALISSAACGKTRSLSDANLGDAGHFDGGSTSSPGIYVTNSNSTITVFAIDATGDAAPIHTIGGPTTGLSLPIGIAVDHEDNLYIANRTGGTITVYPTTADGDVAPSRTLTASGMLSPEALALGPTEDLFAATCPSCGSSAGGDVGVYHFAPAATTSDFSISGASAGFTAPDSLTVTTGGDVYVGNAFGGAVERFAVGATGDATPTRSFTPAAGANIQALTHGTSALALTTPGAGVDFYDLAATGTTSPSGSIPVSANLPVQYPGGLFIDTTVSPELIYLVDFGAAALYVITTSGTEPNLTIASVRTIAGADTALSGPLHVAVVH